MEELARSTFTKAGEATNDRFMAACTGSAPYPDGTAFIAADAPGLAEVVASCIDENRPMAIVHADGLEVLATPPRGPLSAAATMLRPRSRSRLIAGGDIGIPAGYRIKLRSPSASAR